MVLCQPSRIFEQLIICLRVFGSGRRCLSLPAEVAEDEAAGNRGVVFLFVWEDTNIDSDVRNRLFLLVSPFCPLLV